MRATNRQGNRSGLLHSGERFSLCQERFPPAARNPPAYDIGQTTRNSSTAPHVEYADRHCRQKKFADNRFAANPGSSRSLSRFLYADYACSGKRPEQNTPAKRAKIPVPPDKNIRSDEKNSDSVPAVTPSVPDGSRMPPYTPVSCTEWLRSRGSCGSGFPQLPQCARLGGKLFGNPTLPRPWYSNRKADALREQIPAAYPLRERRDERNWRQKVMTRMLFRQKSTDS